MNHPLNDITATAASMMTEAQINDLYTALKSVIDHWDEFGPEHGLDEVIHQARKTMNFYRPK